MSRDYHAALGDLLEGLVQVSKELRNIHITGLCLDSRQLKSGDVFFAVQGSNAHGLDFIDSIAQKTPSVILFESSEKYPQNFVANVPVLAINNLSKHVSEIASRYYQTPSSDLKVTAITGTNGKTTCAFLLTQLLTLSGVDAAMIGTLGSGRLDNLKNTNLTTPDAISLQALLAEFRDQNIKHVVMEASSHALDQYRLDAVQVDVAAFTNLSQDHLDYHQDMHQYLMAKTRLFHFESIQCAVLNAHSNMYKKLRSLMPQSLKVTTYSEQNIGDKVGLTAVNVNTDAKSTSFTLDARSKTYSVRSGLLGEFNVANLLLVLAVMLEYGFKMPELLEKVAQLHAPKGRLQQLGNSDTPTVVVDYAHTPDALEKVLITLKPLVSNELVTVFGCGGDRDKSKRPAMGYIAQTHADRIYLTDDNPRSEKSSEILEGIAKGITQKENVYVIADRATAIRQSIYSAQANDIVLIAGKGHEEYQLINEHKIPFSDVKYAQEALSVWPELCA